jgi:hypothetical protein
MMLDAWNAHHGELVAPKLYGGEESYRYIAGLASERGTVEDWGCGGGGLSAFLDPGQHYVGIDGSDSPFASVRADLRHYSSRADVVVLRHVLEHNHEWQLVLDNAVQSAQRRLIIVLFTPLVDETHVLFTEPDHRDVPVIAFKLGDIVERFPERFPLIASVDTFESPGTAFGTETVIVVDR